jgi:hypothetical protein
MVPTDVLSRVRDQLVEATAAFWTNAELYRAMTDAEHEINLLVSCNIVSTAVTTTTASSAYTLPSDCLELNRLTYDGVPLRKTDQYKRGLDELDQPGYGGSLSTGQPSHYYQINSTVYLWPVPTENKSLRYNYLADTSALASGSTAFQVPANFHTCIQDYVLYRAFLKDQDQAKSEWYKREFNEGIADALRREQRRKWAGGFPTVKDTESNFSAINGMT